MLKFYFYKLWCNNTHDALASSIPKVSDFYIGSTKNLNNRMKLHKNNSSKSKTKLYRKMREYGGFNNWKFTLLFTRILENKRQAEKIEYNLFDLLKPTLNTQRCFNSNGRCIHKKIKSQCLQCKGTRVCIHNRIKNQCKDCKGTMICIHNKFFHHCKDCSPYHCDTCDIITSKGNKIPHNKSKKHYNNIMQRLVEIKQRVEEIKEKKYLLIIKKISNTEGEFIHLNKLNDNQLTEIEQLLNNIHSKYTCRIAS